MLRVWSRELPAAQEAALRAVSPIRDDASWLACRWFPMTRRDRAGTWIDCGRWVLYECIPEAVIRRDDPQNDIILHLNGPQPSRFRDPREAWVRMQIVTDYQCRMYREHKVWARNFWVVQGSQGGHPVQYSPMEEAVLKAAGMPTDPPPVGTLPYADLDSRVFTALAKRRTTDRLRTLDQRRDDVLREMQSADRELRRLHVHYMTEAMGESADYLDWFTRSRTTEADHSMRKATQHETALASDAPAVYVETGILPHTMNGL